MFSLPNRLAIWGRRRINSIRFGVPFSLSRNIDIPNRLEVGEDYIDLKHPNEHGVKADFAGIFLDDCYGLLSLELPDGPSILDVGANVGLFSLAARKVYSQAIIHSYEPNSQLEPYLRHHASRAGFNYFMEAVGPTDGRAELIRDGDSNQTETQIDDAGAVRMVSFRRALSRLGDQVDLLKLDCEGCEWPLFKCLRQWHSVERVVMEYHSSTASEVQHQRTPNRLESLGFHIVKHTYTTEVKHGLVWAVRT